MSESPDSKLKRDIEDGGLVYAAWQIRLVALITLSLGIPRLMVILSTLAVADAVE